ncbi:MAG: hypothetical protein ACPL7K_00120, partial [Armatimonadota bacterium]
VSGRSTLAAAFAIFGAGAAREARRDMWVVRLSVVGVQFRGNHVTLNLFRDPGDEGMDPEPSSE